MKENEWGNTYRGLYQYYTYHFQEPKLEEQQYPKLNEEKDIEEWLWLCYDLEKNELYILETRDYWLYDVVGSEKTVYDGHYDEFMTLVE